MCDIATILAFFKLIRILHKVGNKYYNLHQPCFYNYFVVSDLIGSNDFLCSGITPNLSIPAKCAFVP